MSASIRYSKSREAILSVLRATTCHPSAEWIYQRLKPDHPDLSMGTVYRNLAFFQEHGQAKSVGVIRGQERFDAVIDPHSHFVCERCGQILDLPDIRLDQGLDQTVSRQYGLSALRHELTFHGLCPQCSSHDQTQNFKEEPLS